MQSKRHFQNEPPKATTQSPTHKKLLERQFSLKQTFERKHRTNQKMLFKTTEEKNIETETRNLN